MNISVSTKTLTDMFLKASLFTMDKINAVPILQQGLLRIKKGTLSLQTTNLTDFFYTETDVEKQKEEAVSCFDLKKAKEFILYIKSKQVDLFFEKNTLIISSGKTKGVFQTTQADDFPPQPEPTGEKQPVQNKELFNACQKVFFSSSKDISRPVLSGICFVSKEQQGALVTTDGFRLSIYKTKKPFFPKREKIIISSKTLSDSVKLFDGEEIDLIVDEEKKLVEIKQGKTKLSTRIIEGEFPPYERVLPRKEARTTIKTDKEELINNIKTSAVFVQESSGVLYFKISKDGLYIQPKNTKETKSEVFQEIEFSGEEQKIGFNYRYILDYLLHASGKTIVFEMNDPNSPGVFKTEEEKNFIHIIMPIRSDE